MIKDIEELKVYVLDNQYKLCELLQKLIYHYNNDGAYKLNKKELEQILNYISLLQIFSIRYQKLKKQECK